MAAAYLHPPGRLLDIMDHISTSAGQMQNRDQGALGEIQLQQPLQGRNEAEADSVYKVIPFSALNGMHSFMLLFSSLLYKQEQVPTKLQELCRALRMSRIRHSHASKELPGKRARGLIHANSNSNSTVQASSGQHILEKQDTFLISFATFDSWHH